MKFRNAATIHVCALRHVPDMARRIEARHLVSAISADLVPETPTAIPDGRHLKLNMNDIVEAQPDLIPPDREHVAKLVDFVQSWDQQAPILIHSTEVHAYHARLHGLKGPTRSRSAESLAHDAGSSISIYDVVLGESQGEHDSSPKGSSFGFRRAEARMRLQA